MSGVRKYAGLPDLDPAPDIYETPDLTDDTSTHPATTIRSESAASSYHDPIGDSPTGIDRHRIDPDEARTHFLPTGERDPTLSGRIGSKRKSYRSSSEKRRSHGQSIINGIELSSDEEEEESLERRLARLRREVAEVKGEFERRKVDTADGISQENSESLDNLNEVLERVGSSTADGQKSAAARFTKHLSQPLQPSTSTDKNAAENESYLQSSAPNDQLSSTLTKIADFDTRLGLLETALGIDTIPLPTQDRAQPKAVLPTIEILERQLAALATATPKSLDTLTAQVRTLSQEAETLERKRKDMKRALEALSPRPGSATPGIYAESPTKPSMDLSTDAEAISRINALYGTLSTIESLAPLLPSVLDRLRSLRALHADAATASQSLAEVERKQAEMKEELRGWREGLEKVELAVGGGEGRMKENTAVVEGWIKELEARVGMLE